MRTGKVEGLIGFARRNFMVPLPRFPSYEVFNADLEARCRRRFSDRLRRHGETIGERLTRDQDAFLPLPPSPYDACDKRPGRVSSLSLARYKGNDYSVPVAYGYREVLVRGEGVDHVHYLLRLAELELIDRERRLIERRIKAARFPTAKSLDSFEFTAIPSLNKTPVIELARGEYIERRENFIALGNSGTGKTHIALGLGLAACQKGLSVGFITAAALVHELIEARDEKRLLRLQKKRATYKLLIVDELGFVPLSKTGAELLFEAFSQRYERGATLVTSNLPFDECGPRCSAPSGSPARCSTASPITSFFGLTPRHRRDGPFEPSR